MSAGMPELGSKISLISKADIRYEGRLFTVDPQECTIALASVRSFGTEDRDTSYPILPQQTIYDYILFRGSDIKDIRVVNSVAIPNDPAIMQMHLPTQPPNFPPPNQFPLQQGSPMAQFGPFGAMPGANIQGPTIGQVAAAMKQNQQAQAQQSQSPIQQPGKTSKKNLAPGSGQKNKKSSELSNGIDVMTSVEKSKSLTTRKQSNKSQDSRSGTPNLSRKSPSSDRGHQGNQNQRDNQAGKENSRQGGQRNNQRNNNQQPRERRDSGRNEVHENKGGYRNQNQRPNNQMSNNHQQQQPHQQQQQQRYNNNRNNNYNGNNNNNQMRGNNQGGSARMRGPPMHMNNYRQQSNQGTPNQNQNKQTNGTQPPRKPLKFENEFDFDEANSKFEELRANLARLKVRSTEETQPTEQVNGEVEKKDDSGNETCADPEDAGYDKNKSFFDNISCEAVERSKGKTQRTNWREERKINSETFGYAFNRRGNFRGRGGYYQNAYNRGPRPGGYRGGNPNYRPVRNHRNQNTVEGRPNAPATNGQQSQTMAAAVAAN